MYRQGDVLIVACGGLPPKATAIEATNGRLVLAYGEATGHHHSIAVVEGVELYEVGPEMYLRVGVDGGVAVEHQEHAPIVLPPGDYRVTGQREYSPQEIRRVAD
jgi:hypothetical protein